MSPRYSYINQCYNILEDGSLINVFFSETDEKLAPDVKGGVRFMAYVGGQIIIPDKEGKSI